MAAVLPGLTRELALRAFEGQRDLSVPTLARRQIEALLVERPELRDPQRFDTEVLSTLPEAEEGATPPPSIH